MASLGKKNQPLAQFGAKPIVYKLSFFERSQGQFCAISALFLTEFAQFRAAEAAAQFVEAV